MSVSKVLTSGNGFYGRRRGTFLGEVTPVVAGFGHWMLPLLSLCCLAMPRGLQARAPRS